MFPLLFIRIMKLLHMTGQNTDTMLISEASAEFMVLGKKALTLLKVHNVSRCFCNLENNSQKYS